MAIKDLLNKIKDLTGAAAEEAAETAETVTEEVREEAQEIIGEHKRPEPPKDENGNPMSPPEGMRPPFGMKPPEGMRPPFGFRKPEESKDSEE